MNKVIFSTLLLMLSGFCLQAQTIDAWITAGDKAFRTGDFYPAYKYYGIALEYDSTRADIWYQYGESARNFNAYVKATEAYYVVLNSEVAESFPLTALRMAQVQQHRGNDTLAMHYYQRFLDEELTASEEHRMLAEEGLEDVMWSMEQEDENVTIVHMGEGVNTEYSEFGVGFKGDTLFYSSNRFVNEKDSLNPPRTYVKILSSADGGVGELLPKKINIPGRHVGHTAFTPEADMVYYTVCDYVDTTKILCDLYRSEVGEDGEWSKGEMLGINARGYTTTQPNVGLDPETGQQMLYFVSDRVGGLGGLDIWYTNINEDGTLGVVENFAAINTAMNDATPFMFLPTNTFYFSSDGRQGFGGYDVYRVSWDGSDWMEPTGFGKPINSTYNDMYYSVFDGGKRAYISSNRADTAAIYWTAEKEACCNDIYAMDVNDIIELLALTFNSLDNTELLGATVQLLEITDSGERLLHTKVNFDGNNFPFPLERGKKYVVRATKENYTSDEASIDLTTPESYQLKKIEKKLYLGPGLELEVLTFKSLDSTALDGATVSLYELNAYDEGMLLETQTNDYNNDFTFTGVKRGKRYAIKAKRPGFAPKTEWLDLTDPQYEEVSKITKEVYLDQILEVLAFDIENEEPLSGVKIELLDISQEVAVLEDSLTNFNGNDFMFPIDLSVPYVIIATKPGYSTDVDTVRIREDEIDPLTGKVTRKVYLGNDLADFLPIALYFDNDRPDPRTYLRQTRQNYLNLNEAYYSKKDEFIEEFTQGQSDNEKFLTSRRFDDFFEREVRGGREDLITFSDKLLEYLRTGRSMVIRLKGYASPRASTQYNQILSQRRISSVRNHFSSYREGIFRPYLNNGALTLEQEANGETKAPKTVSSDLNDLKSSVYSIIASVERRVEIVEIKRDTEVEPEYQEATTQKK